MFIKLVNSNLKMQRKTNDLILVNIKNDLIKLIDVQISSNDASGCNKVEYELPVNFDVCGMTRMDAQLIIYSDIISYYDARKYNVKIRLGEIVTLYIMWKNSMSTAERDRRHKIILEHMDPNFAKLN